MSKTKNMRKTIHWQLLTTVSATALLASAYGAQAADADRPLVWIELGGQLERLNDTQGTFSPSFLGDFTIPAHVHALDVQGGPAFDIGEEAKISFQPEDSSWIFTGGIRIGRSGVDRHHHQQTKNANVHYDFSKYKYGTHHLSGSFYPSRHVKVAEGQSHYTQKHAILDFQAGKDVGLGLFGDTKGSSVVSAGVRFVQFKTKSQVTLRGEPDVQYGSGPLTSIYQWVDFKYERPPLVFHDFSGRLDASREFRGVGPSLSWDASLPFAGNADSGELNLDLNINAAALFGRQKVRGRHQTTTKTYHLVNWNNNFNGGHGYDRVGYFLPQSPYAVHPTGANIDRTRSIVVPNIGASVGLSMRYGNAKVSFGYRADLFMNAMDTGIDKRNSSNVLFHGPYASISIGLGD